MATKSAERFLNRQIPNRRYAPKAKAPAHLQSHNRPLGPPIYGYPKGKPNPCYLGPDTPATGFLTKPR